MWCGRQLQRERLPPRALRSFSGKSRGRQPPQRARGGPSNVPATRRPFLGPGRASPPSGSQHPRGRRLPPRRRLQSLRRRLGGAARWRRSAAEGSCAALHAANRPTLVAHCRRRGGSGGASRRGSRLPCGIRAHSASAPCALRAITVGHRREHCGARSQGDVVLTRCRLQHAGPCWSTTCPRCLWTLLTQLKLPRHIKASAADETLYVRVPPVYLVYTPCNTHA